MRDFPFWGCYTGFESFDTVFGNIPGFFRIPERASSRTLGRDFLKEVFGRSGGEQRRKWRKEHRNTVIIMRAFFGCAARGVQGGDTAFSVADNNRHSGKKQKHRGQARTHTRTRNTSRALAAAAAPR